MTTNATQAASKNNYGAVCGIYFLACLGLGGNIPIDATITLEFLPQNRRFLVSLLSMWQPVGVVVASAIAYGTTARYRCDITLPACSAVVSGAPCCSVSSNMGWRYEVIVIGTVTLAIFFLRILAFKFYESPKFLISKGRYQDAIDVLHKIAAYNKTTPPTLTVQDFEAIDTELGLQTAHAGGASHAKSVIIGAIESLSHLKALFSNKLETFIFVLLAIAYMVRMSVHGNGTGADISPRETTGVSTWPDPSCQSFCCTTTFPVVKALYPRLMRNIFTSTFPESLELLSHFSPFNCHFSEGNGPWCFLLPCKVFQWRCIHRSRQLLGTWG